MKGILLFLEGIFSKLQELVTSIYLEEQYLCFASKFFLLLELVRRNLIKPNYQGNYNYEIFMDPVLTVIVSLLSILLSHVCVLGLKKFNLGEIGYEKIDGHYYLREKYVNPRKIFSFFSNQTIDLMVFFTTITMKMFFEKKAALLDSLGSLFIWGGLKYTYLSGITYAEAKKNFANVKKKKTYPLDDLFHLVGEQMKDSIYQMKIFSYRLAYGIRYPESTFIEEYRELYSALKNEENVYVENGFYQDWERAFIIPLQLMLLRERKVVIFLGNSMDVEKIAQWVKSKIKTMWEIEEAWNVQIWMGAYTNCDICVVPFERIPEFVKTAKNSYISPKGVFCLMMEPSKIVAEMKSYLEDYADYLESREIPPVYCFADRYIEGLPDYLAHVFRCKIKKIEIALEVCLDTVWCISRNDDTQDVKNYWGNLDGSGCGTVYYNELLRISPKETAYVSESIMAIKDLFLKIKNKIAIKSQEDEIWANKAYSSTANLYGSIWDIKKQERQFIVADDDNCNYYELYRYLSTRGNKFCALFLLSRRYLLLDFMLDHIYLLRKSNHVIPVLFPVYQDSNRNRLLKLIRRVAGTTQTNITREEIQREFPEWENKDSSDLLKKLNEASTYYFGLEIFKRNKDVFNITNHFLELNKYLWEEVFIIDEKKDGQYMGCILACHLDQQWLEGQYIVRGGWNYQIKKSRRGQYGKEIPLLRSGTYLQNRGFYHQTRTYEICDVLEASKIQLNKGIVLEKCCANISVTTDGWIIKSADTYNGVIKENRNCTVPKRSYLNKEALRISFDNLSSNQQDFYDTLKILLEGMSRTIYPYHHSYLGLKVEKHPKNCLYIIEDCEDDIGLLESIEKNMERILNICYEYARWGGDSKAKGK